MPATGLTQLDRMKGGSGAAAELLTEAVESFWHETRTAEFTDPDEQTGGDLVGQFFASMPEATSESESRFLNSACEKRSRPTWSARWPMIRPEES